MKRSVGSSHGPLLIPEPDGQDVSMKRIGIALSVSAALVLGGLSAATPASAVSLLQAPTSANNILGKPLPALDYAHAPAGKPGLKGKVVPITAGHITPKSACSTP